jgi:hypothetical protein
VTGFFGDGGETSHYRTQRLSLVHRNRGGGGDKAGSTDSRAAQ